jgi:hypothetical protein
MTQEYYQVKILNRCLALKNLDDDDDDDDVYVSKAWEGISKNMKASATESLGYYELKQQQQQQKKRFDEEC